VFWLRAYANKEDRVSGYGAALCPGSLLRAPIPPKDHSSILLVEKRHSTCSTAPWLSLTKAACARTFRSATSPASCQSPALASATRWSPWLARERWSQGSARPCPPRRELGRLDDGPRAMFTLVPHVADALTASESRRSIAGWRRYARSMASPCSISNRSSRRAASADPK